MRTDYLREWAYMQMELFRLLRQLHTPFRDNAQTSTTYSNVDDVGK